MRIKRRKELTITRRECIYLVLYTVVIVAVSVIIHETAHILGALAFGVPFDELKVGFWGINPAVTVPEWFSGTPRTIVYYAGGLTSGAALFLFYILYCVRKYRRNPHFSGWLMGAVTIVFIAMQLATGYLEGRYHAAYIGGAMSLFSPTHLLMYGWAVSGLFFHAAICSLRRMKAAVNSAINTAR